MNVFRRGLMTMANLKATPRKIVCIGRNYA